MNLEKSELAKINKRQDDIIRFIRHYEEEQLNPMIRTTNSIAVRFDTIGKTLETLILSQMGASREKQTAVLKNISEQFGKHEMPTNWIIGKSYDFNLYFHCVLPVGKHTIMVESIDEQSHQIQSREYNTLVPVWNHLIKIQSSKDGKVSYTDEIDLYAGILTGFVAWWSCRFYQHRQRKWKTILRK